MDNEVMQYDAEDYESLLKNFVDYIIEYAMEVKKDKDDFSQGMLLGFDAALSALKYAIEPYDEDLLKRLGLDFDIEKKFHR